MNSWLIRLIGNTWHITQTLTSICHKLRRLTPHVRDSSQSIRGGSRRLLVFTNTVLPTNLVISRTSTELAHLTVCNPCPSWNWLLTLTSYHSRGLRGAANVIGGARCLTEWSLILTWVDYLALTKATLDSKNLKMVKLWRCSFAMPSWTLRNGLNSS